ncbi:SPRY domain-containing SOCS box protein 3-like [Ceratina calcarata]|uniref:SPRY domain-containing SOCS box protein 3-like n=1 Tax=Ceratina calcarata TaxID=156304 RepID=A0AAJ7NDJ6_9HYME|nr:SPRY domain-containing SOCS box protein 3-like [Ceratina calcarata]
MDFQYDPGWLSQYSKFCNCSSENCRCGEENEHEWAWDEENALYTNLSENNLEVEFHNGYSYGTAAVRGTRMLEKGRHHYWEVKMLTFIYGTDVMVGVGTSKVDLNSTKHVFCSFLGLDKESFGYSYKGYIQHGGEKRSYGPCFGQGSLVGVHLDTWRGTLEFFLNRKPLGIAFTGLRDVALYPMVGSTAAQSRMRLTHSCSAPVSLQLDCLSVLKSSHRAYLSAMFPGLRHLTQSIFADILKTDENEDDDEDDDDGGVGGASEKDEFEFQRDYMILDEFDFALVGISRKKKKKRKSGNYAVAKTNITLNGL